MMNCPTWLENKSLQELPALNAFELLGVPVSIEVDLPQLEANYVKVSRWVHPDRHADFPESDRPLLQGVSARVNAAHGELRPFRRRAELLLEILGGPKASEDKSTPEGFLMEVFQLNERLDGGEALLDPLMAAEEKRENRLRELFAADTLNFKSIRVELNALKYEENLLARAEELDEENN